MKARTVSAGSTALSLSLSIALAGCGPLSGVLGGKKTSAPKPEPYLDEWIVAVQPLPGRAVAKAVKPTWCGFSRDMLPDVRDIKHRIANTVERIHQIRADDIAQFCVAPDDPNLQKQLGHVVQAWINDTGQSVADGLASLAARVEGYRPRKFHSESGRAPGWEDGIEAQCKQLEHAHPEESAESAVTRAWLQSALGCASVPLSASIVWFLDRNAVSRSELLDAYAITQHVADAGDFVGVVAAGKRLDAGRLERDIKARKLTPQAATVAREIFHRAVARVGDWQRTFAESGDPAYQQLVDAAEAGWKAWEASYADHRAAYDAMHALEDKIQAPSLDAAAGCSASLVPALAKVLAAARLPGVDAVNAFLREDPLGRQLGDHVSLCKGIEGDRFVAHGLRNNVEGHDDTFRGPRFSAWFAASVKLAQIKAKRPDFPVAIDTNRDALYRTEWPRVIARFDAQSKNGAGGYYHRRAVASVAKAARGARVTWAVVHEKQQRYQCYQSNKVQRIRPDGTLDYQVCTEAGVDAVNVTMPPTFIPSAFLGGIEAGATVVMQETGEIVDGDKVVLPVKVADRKGRPRAVYGIAW